MEGEGDASRNNSSRKGYGTAKACAACKHQRRNCDPDCILAPYFPPDREKQFFNAHKLFGIGKIRSMIENVEPGLRDTTMSSIRYESDMRALDPVGGCYGLIQHLDSHIAYLSAELHSTRQQLAFFKGSSSSSSLSQSQELPNVVDPNSEDIHSFNVEALREEIHNYVNSVPVPPLTLEDKKEEEQNDEEPVVLDLINKIK